jgi:AcrR family transcriptional regulator
MKDNLSARQIEIINASLQLISESGIQSMTIKNLAKRIGFAESAVYRHYENKIQILMAILNMFKQNSDQFFDAQLNSDDNSIAKIESLFINHFNKFAQNPALVTVIFSEEIFRNEVELSTRVSEIMEKNIKSLDAIIQQGQANSEIRSDIESFDLSTIILGSLRMFVKQWHISNFSFDLNERGRHFIESIKLLTQPQV